MNTSPRVFHRLPTVAMFCFFTICLLTNQADAQKTWDGGGDGSNWFDPLNWSPNGVPTASDDVDLSGAPSEIYTPADHEMFANNMTAGVGANTNLYSARIPLTLSGNLTVNGGRLRLSGGTATANEVIVGSTTTGSTFELDGENGQNGTVAFNSGLGVIGRDFGSSGTALVERQAQWNNTGDLFVGRAGNGTLNVQSGGVVSNANGYVGFFTGSGVAIVDGALSQWNNSGQLEIGRLNRGTVTVQNGGVVSSARAVIGNLAGSAGIVTVDGSGSRWNSGDLRVGNIGDATLNIRNGGVVSSAVASIGINRSSRGQVTVEGTGSRWINSGGLSIGVEGFGVLKVKDGGFVSSLTGSIDDRSGTTSTATIDGPGSQWNTGSLSVGARGRGGLSITNGGLVSNSSGTVGNISNSTGGVSIDGIGSRWNNSGELFLGIDSTRATLVVRNGGVITSLASAMATNSGSSSTATINGTGSQWINTNDLSVGNGGTAVLNIENNALVSVGGRTTIGSQGTVNLNGGRFEFGATSLSNFVSINATSGSMAGIVEITGFNNISDLANIFQASNVNISDVKVGNHGVVFGTGNLLTEFTNYADGEVEILANERMRFEGNSSINAGQINNFGGNLRFTNTMTNESTGRINGRGQLIADGGWINQGRLQLSDGTADIFGNFDNQAGGVVISTGDGTTTFFNDVVHNGAEIRTAAGSNTAFFGNVSGAGAYTGLGDVLMEGTFNPGNSPDVISFGGNLILGIDSLTNFELAGIGLGEFDRFEIGQDFTILSGAGLTVSMIDGFMLDYNQVFEIADVGGSQLGSFLNFGEGDRLGTYNGIDLFITYSYGDGNNVALFSAVPEPGSSMVLALAVIGMVVRRRRAV